MEQSPQPPAIRLNPSTLLLLLLILCLAFPAIANAAPRITLSKKGGPPTSEILVSGSGFEPNVGVDIYFDTKDEALVVTNNEGEFHKARIHAPREAYPGEHWVTALERNNDKGAQKPFLVQTNWSQFYFDAGGTRFNPYENVLNLKNVVNLDVKWTYMAHGAIGSSPAVADGVLYVAGSWFDNHLYAINADTGVLLWSYAANGATYSSPAVADGIVYFGSEDDNLYALDARTGALIWTYTTGGYVESPTVAEGIVYVASEDGNLYALNARTGTKVWSYSTGGSLSYTVVVADGAVYCGSDYYVYVFGATNGALLWKYTIGGYVGDIAVKDGVVYATSQDNTLYTLSNGAQLWSFVTAGPIYSAPAVANGVVYVGSDTLYGTYALNARTGEKIWNSETDAVISSPAVANGVVYVNSMYYDVYALDARTGAILWSYLTGDVMSSSPTIADGLLYAATYEDHIYAFSLHQSDQAEQKGTSRPVVNALRPDYNLKAAKSVTVASRQ